MAESHHHSEHHAPSFSPMQRRLYGLSKTIDYPCIDYQIAFK